MTTWLLKGYRYLALVVILAAAAFVAAAMNHPAASAIGTMAVVLWLLFVTERIRRELDAARGAAQPWPAPPKPEEFSNLPGKQRLSGVGEAWIEEKPLTQGDYAGILQRDRERHHQDFELQLSSGGPSPGLSDREWFCRRCHRRALEITIHHPIWDGPFEGAGSGVVDPRLVFYCIFCDPPAMPEGIDMARTMSSRIASAEADGRPVGVKAIVDSGWGYGRPIRLPWLDDLPIQLAPELFEREAYHRLPVKMTRYRPPEPLLRCLTAPDCRWQGKRAEAPDHGRQAHQAAPEWEFSEPVEPSDGREALERHVKFAAHSLEGGSDDQT